MVSETPERQRLFIALYPDDLVRDRLHRIALDLVKNSAARVVPQENLHLTLKFLGSVDATTRACLQRKLERIRGQRFTLRIENVEYRKRQQMLWAVAGTIPDALTRLVTEVEHSSIDCGLAASDHVFRPHLTLARNVHGDIAPRQIGMIEARVEEYFLVSSETRPGGSRYTRLQGWQLNTGDTE